jgi:hypothetical protein
MRAVTLIVIILRPDHLWPRPIHVFSTDSIIDGRRLLAALMGCLTHERRPLSVPNG